MVYWLKSWALMLLLVLLLVERVPGRRLNLKNCLSKMLLTFGRFNVVKRKEKDRKSVSLNKDIRIGILPVVVKTRL